MPVFVTNETASTAQQMGGTWSTTVRFNTAVTPGGGLATPRYSTDSTNMALVSPTGTPAMVAAAGTPMFDNLQLVLKPGHAKPAFVQIDIQVTSGPDTGHGTAAVLIL